MCRSYHTGRDHPACDAVDTSHWHLWMARSTDTTHWSDPRLTSAFLPIKMPRIGGSGNFALTELIASSPYSEKLKKSWTAL